MKRRFEGIWIPEKLWLDTSIKEVAKRVLLSEIKSLDAPGEGCTATNTYFASHLGVAKETVSRWIKEFCDLGYIHREIKYKPGSREIESRVLRFVRYPDGIPNETPMTYSIQSRNDLVVTDWESSIDLKSIPPIDLKSIHLLILNQRNNTVSIIQLIKSIIDFYENLLNGEIGENEDAAGRAAASSGVVESWLEVLLNKADNSEMREAIFKLAGLVKKTSRKHILPYLEVFEAYKKMTGRDFVRPEAKGNMKPVFRLLEQGHPAGDITGAMSVRYEILKDTKFIEIQNLLKEKTFDNDLDVYKSGAVTSENPTNWQSSKSEAYKKFMTWYTGASGVVVMPSEKDYLDFLRDGFGFVKGDEAIKKKVLRNACNKLYESGELKKPGNFKELITKHLKFNNNAVR